MDKREALFDGMCAVIERAPNMKRAVINVRNYFKRMGIEATPFGDGDVKTQAPGTYRRVGASCPSDCPYLGNGCYAQQANVNLHQMRAALPWESAWWAAAATFVVAAVHGERARLHVSGDFGVDGELSVGYIYAIAQLASDVCERYGKTGIAWTYTHFPESEFEPYRRLLADAGVSVLYSDKAGVGGAVVMSHADVGLLKAQGVKYAKCRAQLDHKVSCVECGLCWKAWDLGLCVVLDPHGNGKSKVAVAGAEAALAA